MAIKKDTPVEEVIRLSTLCAKCGKCCEKGSGFVLNHEIQKIARHLGINETNFIRKFLDPVMAYHTSKHRMKVRKRSKPYGHCIFLDKNTNQCNIHEVKPVHCRIGSCKEHGESAMQWYFLNFFVNKDDPSSIREWKIYTDMNNVIEGGKPEDLVGMEKLLKILNYEDLTIQAPKPKAKKN